MLIKRNGLKIILSTKQASPDQLWQIQKSYDDYNKLNNTPLNYPKKECDTRELKRR